MKKTNLLLLLLFFVNTLFAQEYTKIDTVLKEFYYDYGFQKDSTNYGRQNFQAMVLQIGRNFSKFAPVNKIEKDSLVYKLRDISAKDFSKYIKNPIIRSPLSIFCNYSLLKNYPKKGNYELWGNAGQKFHLTDKGKLQMNWKLNAIKDTTILGYKCYKATCHFAGRDYVAWYTPDIAISNGPYKFSGLPGLILSIADTKNQHRFNIYKIKDKVKREMFLCVVKSKYKSVTAVEYARGISREFVNIARMFSGANSKIRLNDEGKKAKLSYKLRSKNNYIEQYPK